MNDHFNSIVQLNGLKQTDKIASIIGSKLRGGEVIELIGDLGSGKTTFIKSLVKGSGSDEFVTSPTFTLRNDYQAKDIAIAHFDFYRLTDPGIIKEMLSEAMIDQGICVILEWGSIVDDILPMDHVRLVLRPTGEHARELRIDSPINHRYLFEGVAP